MLQLVLNKPTSPVPIAPINKGQSKLAYHQITDKTALAKSLENLVQHVQRSEQENWNSGMISLDDLGPEESHALGFEAEGIHLSVADPDNDPNLTTEFWTHQGMHQDIFQNRLTFTGRNQVPSMDLISY